MDIFRIRKNEIAVFIIGFIILALLNIMMLGYNHDLFTRGGNIGFWSIFYDHFIVSGYDSFVYLSLSRWKIYYTLSRHPLIATMLYPLALLNGWLMDLTGVAVIGGAIGNAADQKARGKMDNDYPSNSGYDSSNSGFDSTNSGDDRIDFDGSDATTGNYEYKQPSSPADNVYTHSAPTVEIRNARFIDADGDDTISRGEMCKVVLEIYNNGLQPIYNVVPTVAEMTGNRHIYISQPICVEKIGAYKGVRYTAMVKADNRLKYGTIKLCCSVLQNGETISKVTEFNVETRK